MKHFYITYCKIWALLLLVSGFMLVAHASDDGPGTKKKESDKPLPPATVAVDEAAVSKAAVNAELHKAFAKLQNQLSASGRKKRSIYVAYFSYYRKIFGRDGGFLINPVVISGLRHI